MRWSVINPSLSHSGNRRVYNRRRRSVISSPSRSRSERDREAMLQRIMQDSSPSRSRSERDREAMLQRIMQDSSSSPLRSANNREITALTFTFGGEVGKFLADTIKIGEGSRETISKTQMLLPRNYNAENLFWLGMFIHEAARIWQQNTGRYTQHEGGNIYDNEQVHSSGLSSGQHALAVRDWFYLNYGNEYGLIGTGPNQMPLDRLRTIILGVEVKYQPKFRSRNRGGDIAALLQTVNNRHGRVIKEIRDPKLLQRGIRTRQQIVPSSDTRIRYRTNDRMRRRSV